ncbi:esterase-like activity of phytase family protein [Paracoccus sp. 1_MG-2023]|uniref:esterase-like activity of phytase family protein n=1 Tax=unclassified Paracoccus (in: a-proteobacteria) TaxID=2688777 RepID=UPI001C0810D9|nr:MULTISPECIES: esterase-like activity of phytase family protein [unclassified Paracoccus (in: a-proteobacteria)]MBU2957387.1 esterase-like activity of phytase family protein [Paracoccus sp. C2R09]MDO6670149.1 esterase-like activity of phytase family protein [Paracoccus sp. 1_MG-2023]
MPNRCRRTLTGTLLSIAISTAPVHAGAVLDYVGTYVWSEDREDFGGFSGLELSDDGTTFHALSDRAHLYWGRFERDDQGIVRGVTTLGRAQLRDSHGRPLPPGYTGDSEGLAIGPDGTIHVSFEGLNRIASYPDLDQGPTQLRRAPQIPGMGVNSGLEALAIGPEGQLYTLPETSGSDETPFTLLEYSDDRWHQRAQIRRDGSWLMVGADMGPDGRLYLLERDFGGILGFSSRVRRIWLDDDGVAEDEVVLRTRSLQYDNLEGIAVWDDGIGIRLTMISDDNFLFLQRTEIVEYRLRDE